MEDATTTAVEFGPRCLSEEDIAHCLFLAQIDAGIYYPQDTGQWVLDGDYFMARPTIWFLANHPKADIVKLLAAGAGKFLITYRLAPEFQGVRGYAEERHLEVQDVSRGAGRT